MVVTSCTLVGSVSHANFARTQARSSPVPSPALRARMLLMVDEVNAESYFQIELRSSSTLTGKEEIVTDTWEGLGQQLLLVLGNILEKLIQDALGWSLVIFW